MSDDAGIVSGLRSGDPRAFDRAYAAYAPRLRSFLLRLARRAEVADDLAQETWIKLARAAPTLAPDTRLAPLLFTIARNAFVSHRRWAVLDLSRLLTLGADEAPFARSPEDEATIAEDTRAAEIALGRLSTGDRELVLLIGVEGLAHDEVAAMLGLTEVALRKRLSRARERLAEEIARVAKPVRALGGNA